MDKYRFLTNAILSLGVIWAAYFLSEYLLGISVARSGVDEALKPFLISKTIGDALIWPMSGLSLFFVVFAYRKTRK